MLLLDEQLKKNKLEGQAIRPVFVSVMGMLGLCGLVAAVEAPVVAPIEPRDAFPEPLPELEEGKKKVVPPTYKPKPVAQRITPLADDSFMILPEEAPLPRGTLTRAMLGETKVQAERSAVAQVKVAGEKGVKASLMTNDAGQQVVRLEGTSRGVGRESQPVPKVHVAVPKKPVVKQVKSPPKPKPAKPKIVQKTVKLTYFTDQAYPQDVVPLAKFLAQAKGKKIVHLALTMQSTPIPLLEESLLAAQRWYWLAAQLQAAKVEVSGIPTSEIWLQHATQQFVELELAWQP